MATFGEDQFGLVKQFDAMRNGQGGNPVSLASYTPPPGPDVQMGTPRPSTAPMPAMPSASAGGHSVGDGHNHGPTAPPGQRLVDFGGKKISGGLLSQAQALQSQGLRFTSGYRDPAHNKRVGGVPGSYHTRDGNSGALDFVGTAKQMQNGAAWARQNGAKEVLIHNVGSGQHLHVGW